MDKQEIIDAFKAAIEKRAAAATWSEWWTSLDKTVLLSCVVSICTLLGVAYVGTREQPEPKVMLAARGDDPPAPVLDLKPVTDALAKMDGNLMAGFAKLETLVVQNKPAPVPTPDPKPGPVPEPSKTLILSAESWTVVKASFPDGLLSWLVDDVAKAETKEVGSELWVRPSPDSPDFYVHAFTIKSGKVSGIAKWFIKSGKGPQPPPTPDPKPEPKPEPKPTPSPIPVTGMRVLIIEESANRETLSAGQRSIINGKKFRDYLESACIVGADGKTKEWRIYDKDIATTGEAKHWQDVMQRRPDSMPWIVVSNHPHGGFEGPLPSNPDEAIALIERYKK